PTRPRPRWKPPTRCRCPTWKRRRRPTPPTTRRPRSRRPSPTPRTAMELKPEQLAAQLEAGPLLPAYLIAGTEVLRVLEGADAVRGAAREQRIDEHEVFEFDGRQREDDWNALRARLAAPSLFASRRLIEVRIPSGKPAKPGAQMIVDYCQAPPPDVVLL